MSAAPRPTVDEVIGTLQRSCDPTLLAEGVDDAAMLRRFEDEFIEAGLSIMPLGGRSAVLEIFERRHELPANNIVIFLADKDFWAYTGIPDKFVDTHLLFTDGYSIENDLYRDGDFERLLTTQEKARFISDLNTFLEWYALSLSRKLDGEDVPLSTHPNAILQDPNLRASGPQLRPGEAKPEAVLADLSGNYMRQLRGKSLMALLIIQLSSSSRTVKHSARSLMEHGAVAQGIWIERIRSWLASQL